MTPPKKATEQAAKAEAEKAIHDPSSVVVPPAAPEPVTSHATTYDALVAVMREIDHVAKDGYNNHANYNFRGIDGVLNAVGPAFRRHGVVPTSMIVDGPHWTEVTTSGGKPANACRATVRYYFHGPSAESMCADVAAEAWDHGDKAAPKMMSVAMRTALIQVLALPTQDKDPDQDMYERGSQEGPADVPSTPTEEALNQLASVVTELGLSLPDVAAQLNREYNLENAKQATVEQVENFTRRLRSMHEKTQENFSQRSSSMNQKKEEKTNGETA